MPREHIDNAIKKSIASEEIRDQSLLLIKLHKNGYAITQSTLSRKLKKLGIYKKDGIYCVGLKNNKHLNLSEIVESLITVEPNIIVVRTRPGHANAVAADLDKMINNTTNFLGMAGTIAGDDTIFISCKHSIKRLSQNLKRHFEL